MVQVLYVIYDRVIRFPLLRMPDSAPVLRVCIIYPEQQEPSRALAGLSADFVSLVLSEVFRLELPQ